MTTLNIKYLCAACALCIATIGMTTGASASMCQSFDLVIDCHGDNGNPSWAGTSNTVSLYTVVDGQWNWIDSLSGLSGVCNDEDQVVFQNIGNFYEIDHINFRIDGSNMFWIDHWYIVDTCYNPDNVVYTYGIDDNTGICLSKGPESSYSYCEAPGGGYAWSWSMAL